MPHVWICYATSREMIVRVMSNIFYVKATLVTKAVKLMYWLKSKILPTEIDREVEMFLGKVAGYFVPLQCKQEPVTAN